jgi:hypothetical protein
MFTPWIAVLHRIITGGRFELTERLLGRALTERERHGLVIGEHAGAWETSFMLAQNASLVDAAWPTLGPLAPPQWKPLARLGARLAAGRERRGRDATKLREGVRARRLDRWLLNARFGYGGREITYKGDPSVASVELGQAFREILVRDCLQVVEQVTAGRRVPEDVRSIASDHAVIQPGFVLKTVAIVAGVVLIGSLLF